MGMLLWAELLILQTLIGYCFVIANDLIGMYNIRDLNNMKGDITFVKAHKWIGRIETVFFYAITVQCLLMIVPWKAEFTDITSTVGIHFMIGGITANILFGTKFVIAAFKKDLIYKYGQFIGPIGFIGWSLAHWTSLINYYFRVVPTMSPEIRFVPSSFVFAAILPIIIGIVAVVGGIIGLAASKNAGGVLALVAGAIAILLCVLYFFTGLDIFGIWEYSFLTGILPFDYIILGITIEPFLILAGGITLLASSQD